MQVCTFMRERERCHPQKQHAAEAIGKVSTRDHKEEGRQRKGGAGEEARLKVGDVEALSDAAIVKGFLRRSTRRTLHA